MVGGVDRSGYKVDLLGAEQWNQAAPCLFSTLLADKLASTPQARPSLLDDRRPDLPIRRRSRSDYRDRDRKPAQGAVCSAMA